MNIAQKEVGKLQECYIYVGTNQYIYVGIVAIKDVGQHVIIQRTEKNKTFQPKRKTKELNEITIYSLK